MRRIAAAALLAALIAFPPPSAAQEPGTEPPPPSGGTGASPYARLLVLPDISAVASFAGAWNDYDVELLSPREPPFAAREGEPEFLFEEVELALQAVVDPYARADLFTSFGPDSVEIEEAFLTTLALPAGLQIKAGRFRSPFGRLNQQHPHVQDFVDAPLAPGRLVAAEALSGDGAQVGWLAPTPWFAEVLFAAQSTAVEADGERRMTGVGRIVQYFGVGDATTLGVGVSGAIRAEGFGEHRDLLGADVYVRIRPPAKRAYLALTAEAFARRLGTALSDADWGGYAQAFWRPAPRWGFGIRWDTAPTAPESTAEPGRENRYSGVATFFPSEFQRIRLQVGHDRLPGGEGGLEALLGLEFSIGAHGAHPF